MPVRIRRSPAGDEGIALVVSITIIGLVSILMLTMVAYALRESGSSGRERQRASAVMTAEGQVDTMLARIQGATPATLPCAETVTTGSGTPDETTVATTVTYYDASNTVIACPVPATAAVTSAVVKSQASVTPLANQSQAKRGVESLIQLTPTFNNGLDEAIFGHSGVRLSNNGTVTGQSGQPDANIYTNGDFVCDNNQRYNGSIIAQGGITLSSTCTVDVDAWSRTGFEATNTGVTVGGRVLVSDGNATLVQNATVAGTIRTSGSIAWAACTPAKCFPNASVQPPPYQDFPVLQWDAATAAEWYAAGYTTVVTNNDCTVSGNSNGPGRWMLDEARNISGKTVLLTDCQVVIKNNGNLIELDDDLAVFAKGGFDFRNSVTIRSEDADQRNLYLVQPYDAVAVHPCTTTGISLQNQVTVEDSVAMLLYSPCSIRKANNADYAGQIYAGGEAVIDNRLVMQYRSLPVWGVTTPTTVVNSYDLDIVYKRENNQ